jgi:hypothetical protein
MHCLRLLHLIWGPWGPLHMKSPVKWGSVTLKDGALDEILHHP